MRVSSLHDHLIVLDEPDATDGIIGPSVLSRLITGECLEFITERF